MEHKKLLFLIGTLNSGGAERNVSILANQFASRGWDVTVGHVLPSEVFYEFRSDIKILDFSNKKNRRSVIPIAIRLRRFLRKEHFSTIVSFFFSVGSIVQLVCPKKRNTTLICRETGDPKCILRDNILYKFYEHFSFKIYDLILQRADHIVFQNSYQKSCYSKKLQSHSYLINNPITMKEHRAVWPSESKVFVSVGRLEPVKDFPTMIYAFSFFLEKHPGFLLKIYGEGSQKDTITKLISDLHLSGKVILCGRTTNALEALQEAKGYLHSSLSEGLPNALLEAFLFSVPVITTNWSGHEDIFINRKNCLIVNQKDPLGFAKSIEELAFSPSLCLSLIEEASSLRPLFMTKLIVDQWEKLVS